MSPEISIVEFSSGVTEPFIIYFESLYSSYRAQTATLQNNPKAKETLALNCEQDLPAMKYQSGRNVSEIYRSFKLRETLYDILTWKVIVST